MGLSACWHGTKVCARTLSAMTGPLSLPEGSRVHADKTKHVRALKRTKNERLAAPQLSRAWIDVPAKNACRHVVLVFMGSDLSISCDCYSSWPSAMGGIIVKPYVIHLSTTAPDIQMGHFDTSVDVHNRHNRSARLETINE